MGSHRLRISPDLSLPLEFITQTQAILAKRRVGKSYTASVQAEEMLATGQQIVIIDITGVWWGLKASADGKGEGYPIVVCGGEHGDLPLEESAGETLARAIVADRFSCIVDLKLMRKVARLRFLAAFLETLYLENRHPLHVFADECDDYVPQTIIRGEEYAARALGAMDDLVRRGGSRGIGCSLISQRPAVVNNNVLTQCEILTLLRLVHPADIDAVMKWVKVKATVEEAKRVLEELPTLPVGTAYFWSPGWPEDSPIGVKRVMVRQRTTFDSGRTPRPGEKMHQPKHLAKPDVEKLGERIKAVAEEAKANDPKVIKAELTRARAELAKLQYAKPTAPPAKETIKRVEVPVLRDGELKRAEQLILKVEKLVSAVGEVQRGFAEPMLKIIDAVRAVKSPPPPRPLPPRKDAGDLIRDQRGSGNGSIDLPSMGPRPTNGSLPEGQRRILTAAAQHSEGVDREQLSVLCGYKRSTRDRIIQYLKQDGYMRQEGERLFPTPEGMKALGEFEPLPRGFRLREHWLRTLPEGERRILQVVADVYPAGASREHIGELTGYARSTRDRVIQYLQARKLVTSSSGIVTASDTLYG